MAAPPRQFLHPWPNCMMLYVYCSSNWIKHYKWFYYSHQLPLILYYQIIYQGRCIKIFGVKTVVSGGTGVPYLKPSLYWYLWRTHPIAEYTVLILLLILFTRSLYDRMALCHLHWYTACFHVKFSVCKVDASVWFLQSAKIK